MSIIAERTIEAFAANIGVQAHAAADGSYGFELARSGKLSIVPSEDGKRLIISLSRAQKRADISTQMRLLRVAGFDPVSGDMIYAGIARDGLYVFALSIEDERFDAHTLNDALSKLITLHNSIN